MFCAEHDPLIVAGYLVCDQCQECSYPTSAAWLDDRLIIATFAAGCDHVDEHARVFDPAHLVPESRCVATTRSGRRCRNQARDPVERFCTVHAPEQVR